MIRDGVTDYLRWAVDAGHTYDAASPILAEVLMRGGESTIVDLCAGGGGLWRTLRGLLSGLGCDARIRLTDRCPNHRAFAQAALASNGAVTGEIRPVDATQVPEDLHGVRTIFSAFHHFEHEAALIAVSIAPQLRCLIPSHCDCNLPALRSHHPRTCGNRHIVPMRCLQSATL
ncbi:MAG: hypothetical protein ACO1Q7_04915 [Gemmatimonas sp.]